ncbi:MAG: AsmA family protein [Tenuifilaceae bacterium]|nr:AsmA family protein [Tenuifilaceae bacterium]
MKISKILKKTGKVILITLLSLVVLIIAVLIVALNSEKTITKLALKEVSRIIEAPVKVNDVSLLLFRKFPYATVEFEGFTLGKSQVSAADSSETTFTDTIVSLEKLYVSLKTRPLVKKKIEIETIEIEGFTANYFVDSTGVSNIDFLLATDTTATPEPTDTTEMALDVLLSDLKVRNVTINFKDDNLKASSIISIPEINISGRVLNSYYAGNVSGKMLITNSSFDGTNLNLMQETSIGFMVDYEDGAVNLGSLSIISDGLDLHANGIAQLGDSIYVDMKVDLNEANLRELIKYAPEEMLKEFGVLSVNGIASLNTQISGYLYDTLLLPQVMANLSLKRGSIITTDYPPINHLSFAGNVSAPDLNNLATVSANFKDIRVATDKSHFDLAFSAANLDKPRYNVKTSGQICFDEFASFIPDSTVEYLTGNLAFNLKTHGTLPSNLGMESADYFLERTSLDVKLSNLSTALDSVNEVKNMNIDFSYRPNKTVAIKDFSLDAPGYDISLQNTSLKGTILGYVNDMDNMGIDLEEYFIQMGSNTIEGNLRVKGLEKPDFAINTKANIVIEEFKSFIPDSLVESISGKIMVELASYGTIDLDSIETQAMPIAFEQSTISAQVRDFNFEMFDDTLVQVQNLTLDFAMANDTIRVDNFFAHAHGVDLWVDSTQVWNAYKAFLLEQDDKTIVVNTHVKLGDIDYATFAHLVETDTTQAAQTPPAEIVEETAADSTLAEPMFIPPYIVRGTAAVNSVKYGDILLKNLSTLFRVDSSLYVIDKFKFDGFNGSMVTSAVYDTRDTITNIMFRNEIFGMDIHQLLVDGDNFGQENITHENISGKLTSSIDGRVQMQDTTIFYDKILVKGNMRLEDGGIYNFEPLMEVGKFTNLRELENLVFKTLKTSIFIHKNNIYFPKTDIVSSAIDLSALGVQSFDSDYQYHMTLFLRDVLVGKSKNLLKQQGMEKDGFKGDDQSDRKGLYLVAMDRNGEKRHRWDNDILRKNMVKEINIQGIGLGIIFNPRLVNYSTDIDRREGKTRLQEE